MTGVGQESDPELQRSIGFVGLLALSVGINIGAGVFLLANIAGAITGPTLPIAMVIAAVPALLALVPFTMLARGRPTTAVTYRYIQLCYPRLAFLVVAAGATAILVVARDGRLRHPQDLLPVAPILAGTWDTYRKWRSTGRELTWPGGGKPPRRSRPSRPGMARACYGC